MLDKNYELYMGDVSLEIIEVLFKLIERLKLTVKVTDAIQTFHLVVKTETNVLLITHMQENPSYEYKVKIPFNHALKYSHYTICVIDDKDSILDASIMIIDAYS